MGVGGWKGRRSSCWRDGGGAACVGAPPPCLSFVRVCAVRCSAGVSKGGVGGGVPLAPLSPCAGELFPGGAASAFPPCAPHPLCRRHASGEPFLPRRAWQWWVGWRMRVSVSLVAVFFFFFSSRPRTRRATHMGQSPAAVATIRCDALVWQGARKGRIRAHAAPRTRLCPRVNMGRRASLHWRGGRWPAQRASRPPPIPLPTRPSARHAPRLQRCGRGKERVVPPDGGAACGSAAVGLFSRACCKSASGHTEGLVSSAAYALAVHDGGRGGDGACRRRSSGGGAPPPLGDDSGCPPTERSSVGGTCAAQCGRASCGSSRWGGVERGMGGGMGGEGDSTPRTPPVRLACGPHRVSSLGGLAPRGLRGGCGRSGRQGGAAAPMARGAPRVTPCARQQKARPAR